MIRYAYRVPTGGVLTLKAVILAGGYGSRLSEETTIRPKPMVEIGGKPMLWHIMKIYSHYGINDFIICCGYKGYMIKEYFMNYFLYNGDITVNLKENNIELLTNRSEPWTVTCIDTGLETATGGRLLQIREYLGDEPFCFTLRRWRMQCPYWKGHRFSQTPGNPGHVDRSAATRPLRRFRSLGGRSPRALVQGEGSKETAPGLTAVSLSSSHRQLNTSKTT